MNPRDRKKPSSEKSRMREPQEEFIAPEAVPSEPALPGKGAGAPGGSPVQPPNKSKEGHRE